MATHVTLVLAGIACLSLSAFMVVTLRPRQGRPPSAWISTDTRATCVALSVLILALSGVSLIAKALT